MLSLGRLESRKRRRGAASCPACGGPEEDATHFVFTCVALHAVRDRLYSRLDAITTGAFGQLMYDEPLDTALLGWGTTTGVSRQQQLTKLTHVYGLSWWRHGLHGRRRLLPGGRLFWRWLWMLSRSLHR
jgi:hypothetical protein